jgi:hypothetical protein
MPTVSLEVTMGNPKEAADDQLDGVSRLLANRLEDEEGNQADPAEVAEVVRAKAHELEDARITEFVPLLTERKARDELRARGLHPRWENPLGDSREGKADRSVPPTGVGGPVGDGKPEPGWYADPLGQHFARWWDGGRWTTSARDRPVTAASSPVS